MNSASPQKFDLPSQLHYFAWFFAACATAGSLFFSEVMSLPPCVLCWYQRIAMYPIVIVLGVSIVRNDRCAKAYGLSLAIPGLLIAIYHNLLYFKIIPQSIIPCTSALSCTAKQIEWFGFVTIPFLSMVAFALIVVSLAFFKQSHEQVR